MVNHRHVSNNSFDHPNPEAVKNISMDMSPAFISGVTTYFQHAKITFDKWHVIKLYHKHLKDLHHSKAISFTEPYRLYSLTSNRLLYFDTVES